MKHKIVNTLFVATMAIICVASFQSCAGTKFPPVTVKGKINDQDVKVVIYPDGSHPNEIEIGGGKEIVIDLEK